MTATLSRPAAKIAEDENTFLHVSALVKGNLHEFTKTGKKLFVSTVAEDIWECYLAAFPAGSDPVFRERTDHDCNCCRNFVRNLGAVVKIKNNELHTVWDNYEDLPEPYLTVCRVLSAKIKAAPIQGLFSSVQSTYGSKPTRDNHNRDIVWHHFYTRLPKNYIVEDGASIRGTAQAQFGVLQRGLQEFTTTTLDVVLEGCEQNIIYLGEKYKPGLQSFKNLLVGYNNAKNQELFIWEHHSHSGAQIRNTVIGTLLQDLQEGRGFDQALRSYESKTAPGNYMRPTPTVTPRMIDAALETIRSLDLEAALYRRHARVGDISVQDVCWVNNETSPKMQDPLRSLLVGEAKVYAKPKDDATVLTPEQLLALKPSKIEVLLSSRHLGNFMTLTAPVHPELNSLFVWGNSFGWSYDGDVTDSITTLVKKAGGDTTAPLRSSLRWFNRDDLDIHCWHTPPNTNTKNHIFYGSKQGVLDVDANAGTIVPNPVENLSWTAIKDGLYEIKVYCFTRRSDEKHGFEAEFVFLDKHCSYSYSNKVTGYVPLISFMIRGGKLAEYIVHPGIQTGGLKELKQGKWGVHTLQPTPVETIMLSPNYWDNSGKTGNKHWFFILKDCKTTEPTRGIYNEFLHPSLHKHRKVFELLGSKTKCEPATEQLSGVGFSTTLANRLDVLVDGRPYKVVFGSDQGEDAPTNY